MILKVRSLAASVSRSANASRVVFFQEAFYTFDEHDFPLLPCQDASQSSGAPRDLSQVQGRIKVGVGELFSSETEAEVIPRQNPEDILSDSRFSRPRRAGNDHYATFFKGGQHLLYQPASPKVQTFPYLRMNPSKNNGAMFCSAVSMGCSTPQVV